MRIALLTGGGDSPAMNAAIRAVVRKSISDGIQVIGVKNGWQGLVKDDVEPMYLDSVTGIIQRGGTILGTSRTNPFKVDGGADCVHSNIKKHGIDAVIAIGGDDTNGVAMRLGDMDIPCVGIPQTIDTIYRGATTR
jgi:6-phosphofructokinase 1